MFFLKITFTSFAGKWVHRAHSVVILDVGHSLLFLFSFLKKYSLEK